jgi:hypothetical protein
MKFFNWLTKGLLANFNFLVSTKFLKVAHTVSLDLFVVLNPFLYTLEVPCFFGSLKKIPLKFSSPYSLITTMLLRLKCYFPHCNICVL